MPSAGNGSTLREINRNSKEKAKKVFLTKLEEALASNDIVWIKS
tara:strand:- start:606 stop:737 length:132 start_codon:yes stop_codon:yes gene_type:complete